MQHFYDTVEDKLPTLFICKMIMDLMFLNGKFLLLSSNLEFYCTLIVTALSAGFTITVFDRVEIRNIFINRIELLSNYIFVCKIF